MSNEVSSRRNFLKIAGAATGAAFLPGASRLGQIGFANGSSRPSSLQSESASADYTLRIAATPIEIAPKLILSTITYNGAFPGPLLRFKEGRPVSVEIHNDTDTPEQMHWHGQFVSTDVDGAAEEGTPFIPAHGMRRINFTPRPAGLRFYHSHNRAGADLHAGQYSGQVGPVYIEAQARARRLRLRGFSRTERVRPHLQPGRRHGDGLPGSGRKSEKLEETGESAMKASLAKGMPHGFEVGYRYFTINGRMLGHGEPVRVKHGERVLFHVLNGSATEIRSLALPGHTFKVIALDGNRCPRPRSASAVAGNGGTHFGDRRDESSGRLDHGRPRE